MARKQRRNHKPRDLYAEVTDRIVASLEQGVAPWVCPWRRDGEGGRPRNGSSGHVYRGINTILTGMAGFGSSRWYTFKQAKDLDGSVGKGEKGTQVVYWRFIEPKGDDRHDDEKPSRKFPLLRCYTVFNAEQIDWAEGSKHAVTVEDSDQRDDDDHEDVRKFVDTSGADVRHGGVRAYYDPNADYIRVPDARRFDGADDYFATVLHELAHWTGHASRLARDLTGRFGSDNYAAEELVAELTAAFLCADLSVAGKLQHAEYIGSWIKVLQGDKRAVFTAARMAQEAADLLTSNDHRESENDAQGEPGAARRAA